MPTRRVRLAILAGVAALLLSGCEMSVRIGTRVDAGGRGAFTLGIDLDREMLDGLRRAEADGVGTLEGLFARLGSQGWATAREENGEGLALSAEREFADEAGFEAALRELGSAPASESGPAAEGAAPFTLDYRSDRSFLKTRNSFSGEIDTTAFFGDIDAGNRRLLDQLSDEIARVVRFEVSAALPGSVSVSEGDGTVGDGVATWRPTFGSTMRFAAASSAIRMSSLLFIAVPVVLLIVGALLWAGVRRTTLVVEQPTPHRVPARRVVLEPATAPDETSVALEGGTRIEIDLTDTTLPAASNGAPGVAPNGAASNGELPGPDDDVRATEPAEG